MSCINIFETGVIVALSVSNNSCTFCCRSEITTDRTRNSSRSSLNIFSFGNGGYADEYTRPYSAYLAWTDAGVVQEIGGKGVDRKEKP